MECVCTTSVRWLGVVLTGGGCVSLVRSAPSFFFFNDTATTEIYTLSLHDALPIWDVHQQGVVEKVPEIVYYPLLGKARGDWVARSEEHTSELQSRGHLVCRLLLEKKKQHRVVPTGGSNVHQNILATPPHAALGRN